MKKKLFMLVIFIACTVLPLIPTAIAEEPMSLRIDNPNPFTGNSSTLLWTVSPTDFGTLYVLPGHSVDLVVTINNDPSSDTTWDWDYMIFQWSGYGDFDFVELAMLPPEIDPGNSWTGTIGTFTVFSTTPLGTQITGQLRIQCSIPGAQPEYYEIPVTIIAGSYTLTIDSLPTGVTFTVDSVYRTTPWSGTYSYGASVSLVMPETHDGYVWDYWLEDGDPNRIKTVIMDTNITLTAVYEPTPEPVGGKATPINIPMNKPETTTLWIWLTTIILSLSITVGYVKKKKEKYRD